MTKMLSNTGVSPIKSNNTVVEVTYMDGEIMTCKRWAHDMWWELVGDSTDIVYYRILTPETEVIH